jgi:ATP-dependent helicase/nuclease subunit A
VTRTIPDARERARALDAERSFIVQAPAGSGKTELLIQRFLTLLARVDEPEYVVAITFTRKAAGEMRRRVLRAIAEAVGPQPAEEHAVRTWTLARAVLDRDRARGWQLTRNPNRLRIRTIDALCSSLARQMPWLSRLGAPLAPVEAAAELYAEAARRTIEMLQSDAWSPAIETLLLHLDNDFRKLQGLLAGMLARRDQWRRHIVPGADPAELRALLEESLGNAIRDGVAPLRALLDPETAAEIVELAAFAAAQMLEGGKAGRITACAGLGELPEDEEIGQWLGIRDLLLTKGGDWRKKPDVRCGFPATAKAMKARHAALLETIASDSLRAALCELDRLPAAHYPERQWEALAAVLSLLPGAVAQLRVLFRERGEADFTEVSLAALEALGDAEAPTDLALSLDYRIQHLLVDEFQDTSVTQIELLRKLTAGWEQGDGRTLFVVGDPMQSIYRFREAEVGLFLQSAREGIGNVALEPLVLSANFRSGAGVVEWVNASFPEVLAREEDIGTGAISFRASVPVRAAQLPVAVEFHAFLNRDDEEEARQVLAAIRAAHQRDAQLKVAILVRARSHLTAILPALRAAGMRYRAVDIDPLGNEPVIRDLSALTRALLHPADRIAWLAVLRAPWCGLNLADLHTVAAGSRATVWDTMHEEERVAALTEDGRTRLERVRETLGTALGARGGTLRQWVEGTWLALGGPACADGAAAMDNAAAFFSALEDLDEARGLDLAALDTRIARLCARPDPQAGDTLQVMTIHKAKGLEFDVVLVPGLGRKTPPDNPQLLLWLERPHEAGIDLLLAPIQEAGGGKDPTYQYLRSVEKRKQEFETGRLLYVAATRAKQELHLFGATRLENRGGLLAAREPEASSLLRRLWPVVASQFAELAAHAEVPQPKPDEAVERPVPPIVLRRLPAAWQLPAPPAAVQTAKVAAAAEAAAAVSFAWVGDTLRHVGTVAHALLHRIALEGLEQWPAAAVEARTEAIRSALLTLGVPAPDMDGAAAQVKEAVQRTLADERGRWILSDAHTGAANEYGISGMIHGRVVNCRVDRTFVDSDGVRWIVDYKTSAHEGGGVEEFLDTERERYREQLEGYLRVFSLLEARPVRAGLYFPLLGGWREVTAAAATGLPVSQAPA